MALDTVIVGQAVTIHATFRDGAEPFVATSQAQWDIRDPQGRLILSGVGAQSPDNPALWSATLTLPSQAPPTQHGERYVLTWRIHNDSKEKETQEHFAVQAAIDFEFQELDRLMLAGALLTDTLTVDAASNVSGYSLRVLRESGEEIFVSGPLTPSTPVFSGNQKLYSFEADDEIEGLTADGVTFKPYIIEWTAQVDGAVQREFHFLYVVSPRTLTYMHELRRFIDKARAQSPNPALRYNDVDLVAYLDQGVQMINMMKPSLTQWSVQSLPGTLSSGLIHAAAYCALSAQYLAEGQAAFEFSGQAVNLSVDRTQSIDGALGRIMDFINNNIPTAKRLHIRQSGGAGVLGINLGPSLGWAESGWRVDYMRRMAMSGGRY